MTTLTATARARALIEVVRPHNWVKNVLIAVALFTSQGLGDSRPVIATFVAFVAFSLMASSVYIINDLVDAEHDRQHPTKKNRPFASRRLAPWMGWVLGTLLIAASLALAVALLPLMFTAVLVGYAVLCHAYSFRLKRVAVLDVICLCLFYTVRVVAGAVAIDVRMSVWFIGFSMLLFFSLGLVKRVNELTRLRRESGKMAGRGYQVGDLELLSSFGTGSAIGSVVVFMLFINDGATTFRYATPEILWAAIPVLLYMLARMWLLAHRGSMHEDPVEFIVRDRASFAAGVLIALVFAAAKFIGLP